MALTRIAAQALLVLGAGLCAVGASGAGSAPGQPDLTWAAAGRLFVPVAGGRGASVGFQGLVRLPSGKFVAGLFNYTDCLNTYLLFRADRRGKPDETFGKHGLRAVKGGSTGELVLLPGGKLLAGDVRVEANGSVDKTFHPPNDLGRHIIQAQPDGRSSASTAHSTRRTSRRASGRSSG